MGRQRRRRFGAVNCESSAGFWRRRTPLTLWAGAHQIRCHGGLKPLATNARLAGGFTGIIADRYRFRTPSLRNVYLTGPWGHDGFYNSLELVVRHHLDPVHYVYNADASQTVMRPRDDLDAVDPIAFEDPAITAAIAQAIEIDSPPLSDHEIAVILEFLQALTDPSAQDLRKTVPFRVPSGLPLAEIK